jgi:exosortase/archaeosortase family protein
VAEAKGPREGSAKAAKTTKAAKAAKTATPTGETPGKPGSAQTPLLGIALAGRPARRFVLMFVVIAGLLLPAYYFPYSHGSSIERVFEAYLHGYAVVAGGLLRLFDRGVFVVGQDITGAFSLRLVKTCDAMDVTLLFVSAVVAWPGDRRRRLLAALAGAVLLFFVNTLRICALYLVGLHFPSSFELVHLEIAPIVLLAVAVGAFFLFSRWMARGAAPAGGGGAAVGVTGAGSGAG